jgi:hypothetical protein
VTGKTRTMLRLEQPGRLSEVLLQQGPQAFAATARQTQEMPAPESWLPLPLEQPWL